MIADDNLIYFLFFAFFHKALNHKDGDEDDGPEPKSRCVLFFLIIKSLICARAAFLTPDIKDVDIVVPPSDVRIYQSFRALCLSGLR